VATIRDCFLVDISAYIDLEIVYCSMLKDTQNQLSKYRKCYLSEIPDMTDKVIYTSDIIMDLKKTLSQFRKAYIPPNIPKFVVDG
jgi:hypothetical protein